MFRPLALFVGLRYLLPRRGGIYVSFMSLISLLGICVGVLFLVVVLSVMNGFSGELRERLLSMTAHARIVGADGAVDDWRALRDRGVGNEGVVAAAPFVEGEGMLVNGVNLSGVLVAGIDPGVETGVSGVTDSLVIGELDTLLPGERNMIVGALLAQRLGLRIGDRVTILVPRATAGGDIRPLLRRFTLTGIFEVGIQEHDGVRALVHLDDAASLYAVDGAATGLRVRFDDIFAAPVRAPRIATALGPDFVVTDWSVENATFFRAIRIEKTMMFLILLLIVAVAAFNIVASLVMVVTDKRTEIAILRTIGMRPRGVMGVFIVQGLFIGIAGVALGLAGGVAIALNIETVVPRLESLLGIKLIPADVFYIAQIPSDLRWPEVAAIGVTAFALSFLSTLYPAWRASKTQPAEALRYE